MSNNRVVLAGGSGFIGKTLAAHLQAQGHEVVILTRSRSYPDDSPKTITWNGATVGAWARSLDGALAVVNLTGKNVYCRHTEANRREIIRSRVDAVRAIGEAIEQCERPPAVSLQVSGTHFYGNPGDRVCDETSPPGDGFLAEVCRRWEGEFEEAKASAATKSPGVRHVLFRLGLAMGRGGGAMEVLMRLTRWFLGGAVGSGTQYVSWLHCDDLARFVSWAIGNWAIDGIYNAVSPDPVTNAEFMRELRRVMHRPWSPPAPALAIRIGGAVLGFAPELALTGQRCVPRRLLGEGFTFEYPDLVPALRSLIDR